MHGVDPSVPSVARIYDYFLGGKDNYAADRAAAARILEVIPHAPEMARANRAFLGRVVRHLVGVGIDQFLDLGTGLPTRENVHEVATEARVVYVDNDPVVLVHARALLADSPRTEVVEGNLHDPERILADAGEYLDFGRPVAVLLMAILHFFPDDAEVAAIVAALRRPLAPGSCVAVSHGHAGELPPDWRRRGRAVYAGTYAGGAAGRGKEHLAGWLDGLELVPPGIVPVQKWHSTEETPDPTAVGVLGAVGFVPH
ncbi:SAM-dependent methyltransferase [Nonomuraea sediminis]|uniref:SAM-dependent methyltransferase n=1 Tax=Nonomuraea sediminis TaxID=2835864 RepID=UPI001BDD81F9|nr:SAM-dependent methyltransferase [Nonomuraea sediminis]